MATLRCHEDPRPGAGLCRPRADVSSDAAALSLDGAWRFRLAPSVANSTDGFAADGFDDRDWDTVAVPGQRVHKG